jgi:alkanesulfonate monooxygenase SsuD/methylene tetrahydromethanopterin reductase-like flavin-dependent oxidoreductase (luciferase family)
VLPNRLYDPIRGAEEYARHIDALVYAEELGFDAIGVNEHHQTAYGLMPAPNLIASALIQRTKRVQIAILGRALPLVNNPIYIAEEFAMLDNLSKGRIIAGFVRGIGSEYHSSGTNPYFSHERWKRRRENPSLTEAAGSSGCAGVKLRQQMAFARSRQGSRDEGRGTLWAGSLCGSD